MDSVEARYNRARIRRCLNCGNVASYCCAYGRKPVATCKPLPGLPNGEHEEFTGADVAECWKSRFTTDSR